MFLHLIEKLKSERSEMTRTVKQLRENLENEFSGSMDELKRILAQHKHKIDENKDVLLQVS